jgi:hypothetical protein
MHPLRLPIIDDIPDDGGNIMDTPAADADGDMRARLQARSEFGGAQLLTDGGGYIGDLAIGKFLANQQETRELHNELILTLVDI